MKPAECSPRKNKILNLMGKLKVKKVQPVKVTPSTDGAGTLPVEVQGT